MTVPALEGSPGHGQGTRRHGRPGEARGGSIWGAGAALPVCRGPTGAELPLRLPAAKDLAIVLDEQLGEQVQGHEGAQGRRSLGRPDQVQPKDAGQVGAVHFVKNALLGHLVQEAHEVAEDGVVVPREALQDLAAAGHPQAALHAGDPENLLVGLEGEQRLGQLPQEGLQDDGRDVDVPVVVKVHGLPLVVEPLDLSDSLDAGRSPEQTLSAESCRERASSTPGF